MAGKSDFFETVLLNAVFRNTFHGAIAGIFVAPAVPADSLYVSLHSSDPAEAAANQTTNEVAYTGYLRQGVLRATGFTLTGNSISPVANIDFPACTAGSATATHFAIGTVASGAGGQILYSGPITPTIPISIGTIPRLTPLTAITED